MALICDIHLRTQTNFSIGWWCAKENLDRLNTPTSFRNSDSCFCVLFTSNFTTNEESMCSWVFNGGYLAEAQNEDEHHYLANLMQKAANTQVNSKPQANMNHQFSKEWQSAKAKKVTKNRCGTLERKDSINTINQNYSQQIDAVLCRKDRYPCGENDCLSTESCKNEENCYTCVDNKRSKDAEETSLNRQKRQTCAAGWALVNGACLLNTNITGTYSQAVSYCNSLGASLPVIISDSDFTTAVTWWNSVSTGKEYWIGLTLDTATNLWTWNNNCTFNYLPGFWNDNWNPNSINASNPKYFAKLGNIYSSMYTSPKDGAKPAAANEISYIVCKNPNPSGCFSFPDVLETDYACPNKAWYCAQTLAPTVTTAVVADSCFCAIYANMTFAAATSACQSYGGFLSDVRSTQESNLLSSLFGVSTSTGNKLAGSCPAGFSYFGAGDKCWFYSKSANVTSPGAAETECKNLYGGRAASVHTYRNMWFLSYLMMKDTTSWNLYDYGAYTGGKRTSTSGPWSWTDGSAWDYGAWTQFPYAEPNGQFGVTISRAAGRMCDYGTVSLPYFCQAASTATNRYVMWVNMLSNTTALNCTWCTDGNGYNAPYAAALFNNGALSAISPLSLAAGAICRIVTTTTTTTTSAPTTTAELTTSTTTMEPTTTAELTTTTTTMEPTTTAELTTSTTTMEPTTTAELTTTTTTMEPTTTAELTTSTTTMEPTTTAELTTSTTTMEPTTTAELTTTTTTMEPTTTAELTTTTTTMEPTTTAELTTTTTTMEPTTTAELTTTTTTMEPTSTAATITEGKTTATPKMDPTTTTTESTTTETTIEPTTTTTTSTTTITTEPSTTTTTMWPTTTTTAATEPIGTTTTTEPTTAIITTEPATTTIKTELTTTTTEPTTTTTTKAPTTTAPTTTAEPTTIEQTTTIATMEPIIATTITEPSTNTTTITKAATKTTTEPKSTFTTTMETTTTAKIVPITNNSATLEFETTVTVLPASSIMEQLATNKSSTARFAVTSAELLTATTLIEKPTTTTTTASDQLSKASFIQRSCNQALQHNSSYIMKSFAGVSLATCVDNCSISLLCSSVNYNSFTTINPNCELFTVNSANTSLVCDPGWMVFEKL